MRRFTAILLLSAAATSLAPGLAQADLTVVVRESDGHDETRYYRDDRLRIQDLGDMGPEGALLFDARDEHIVLVYDDAKAYFDYTKALRSLKAKLVPFAEMARRALARQPTVDVQHLPLHDKRIINGFACEMYDQFDDGRVTEENCIAPWTEEIGARTEWELGPALFEAMASSVFGKHLPVTSRSSINKRPPGVAIWTQEIRPDRSRGEIREIRSVKLEPIPAAIFSVPPDYHEVDEPLDPPRDGAQRQRALRLARASPRDATPSPAPAPNVGATLGLGLVIMLTFGLFVHAFFLNLAAQWVIPEARFSNALVATAAVWAVTIPLELMHTWPPAEIAIGALASFVGIRLAYRASTGRAMALLFVSTVLALIARFLLTGSLASLLR